MQDVEVSWIAGTQHAIGIHMGMRVAALPGNGVDALHMLGPEIVQHLAHQADAFVLPHARPHHPVQLLIRGIDHHAGRGQQGDLVLCLDLADLLHQALAVDHGEAFSAQRLQHGNLNHVDPQGRAVQLSRLQLDPDLPGHVFRPLRVGAPQR